MKKYIDFGYQPVMHRGLKSPNVFFSKINGDWPHCYKTIRGKVSVIVYAYRQVYAYKSNGRFLDTKVNLMHSSNLFIVWWMYKVYVAGQFL